VFADLMDMTEFAVADIRREEFAEAPIPADQVIDGAPVARSCDLHSSREAGVSMNLWDCTAGRFYWHYGSDELVEILEGEVRVSDAAGEQRVLRPGDTAHFPAGTSFVWEVPEYVKKLAIHRAAKALPDRILWKITRMLSRRRANLTVWSCEVWPSVMIGVVGCAG
jgi:uncharacterized cupin superfamily protein